MRVAMSILAVALCCQRLTVSVLYVGCQWRLTLFAAWQAEVHAEGGRVRSLTGSCRMHPQQTTCAG